jgi:hypothetical protein
MPDGPRSEQPLDGAMAGIEASCDLPEAPRLPERAAIYVAPDGTVHFGALFDGLLPVAEAIGGGALRVAEDVETEPAPDDADYGGEG